MQINDITAQDIRNIVPTKLVDLARENIIIMTFAQFQQILGQRTANETYLAVHSVLNETTYFGFFQDVDNPEIFYITIYTGTKIPYDLTSEWIRLQDLRIATTRTSNLPLTIYSATRRFTDVEKTFAQTIFAFITGSYINKNVTMYALAPRTEEIQDPDTETVWCWQYAKVTEILEDIDGVNIPIANLVPMPGINDTVLFVDRARNTHQFTFKGDLPGFVKIDSRMVL